MAYTTSILFLLITIEEKVLAADSTHISSMPFRGYHKNAATENNNYNKSKKNLVIDSSLS